MLGVFTIMHFQLSLVRTNEIHKLRNLAVEAKTITRGPVFFTSLCDRFLCIPLEIKITLAMSSREFRFLKHSGMK